VIGVCVLIALLEGYDVQAFGVAAPRLAPELGLNPGQIGLAGSAANIGLLLGALLGGWAADRWGRKPVLLASVIAFGAFSLATAAAHGFDLAKHLINGGTSPIAMHEYIEEDSALAATDHVASVDLGYQLV